MSAFKNYLSLIKFSHTIFAMPFALIGFVLGVVYQQQQRALSLQQYGLKLLLVLVCMVTARSAAMAFNRYLDRHFDAKNPRTAIREIPKGIISANGALNFTIANCIVFIAATYCINTICFYLSVVALFVILFYSYTKRFTALCHIVLGIGLSLAPIGAYLAVTGVFNLLPLLFSGAVICWVSGFDIIFALQDVQFDQQEKLYSIPSVVGIKKALFISTLLHVASAAFIIAAGVIASFSIVYYIGVIIFIVMLVYQHSIVKPNDLSKINIAFITANGIASVVFAIFVIAEVLIGLIAG
jgi:4-hydroxybenzoate polyprenyltransferase